MEQAPEESVVVEDREAQPVLSVRRDILVADLAQAQSESLGELGASLRARGVDSIGPPFVRYHAFGEMEEDVEVGVPVAETAAGEGRVAAGVLPGGPAIVTWHLGAHDRLGEAYRRLEAWLQEHEREAAGPAWEVYWWIDPSQELEPSSWPAPADWRTELVQPMASMGGGVS
jgi:effector-binding domain-containing protein